MKNVQILAIPLLVVLVLLIGMGAGACGGGNGEEVAPPGEEEEAPPSGEEEETTPTDETMGYELPESGNWTVVTAGSSEFNISGFTVNASGTGIISIVYSFTGFQCMGVTISGGVECSREPMWPIIGNQLTIDLTERIQYGDNWDIIINGNFDNTGTHASGTWEISSAGTLCQEGTWEASAP